MWIRLSGVGFFQRPTTCDRMQSPPSPPAATCYWAADKEALGGGPKVTVLLCVVWWASKFCQVSSAGLTHSFAMRVGWIFSNIDLSAS